MKRGIHWLKTQCWGLRGNWITPGLWNLLYPDPCTCHIERVSRYWGKDPDTQSHSFFQSLITPPFLCIPHLPQGSPQMPSILTLFSSYKHNPSGIWPSVSFLSIGIFLLYLSSGCISSQSRSLLHQKEDHYNETCTNKDFGATESKETVCWTIQVHIQEFGNNKSLQSTSAWEWWNLGEKRGLANLEIISHPFLPHRENAVLVGQSVPCPNFLLPLGSP